jgi:hypothetical protein
MRENPGLFSTGTSISMIVYGGMYEIRVSANKEYKFHIDRT